MHNHNYKMLTFCTCTISWQYYYRLLKVGCGKATHLYNYIVCSYNNVIAKLYVSYTSVNHTYIHTKYTVSLYSSILNVHKAVI